MYEYQTKQDIATALDFLNKVFDSVNAHTLRLETLLRVAVSKNSKHHNFWQYAIRLLSDMRYINPKIKKLVRYTYYHYKIGFLLYVDFKTYGK